MSSMWSGVRSWLATLLQMPGFGQKQATIILLGQQQGSRDRRMYMGGASWGSSRESTTDHSDTRADVLKSALASSTVTGLDNAGKTTLQSVDDAHTMADGIIFMIDANDPQRFDEVAQVRCAGVERRRPAAAACVVHLSHFALWTRALYSVRL
jgi:hypothetical protein